MTSTFDDDDLALSINPSHTRRGSARSPSETPAQDDPMHHAARRAPHTAKLPTSRERLGQYQILKTLGEGSFGKVRLAKHERTGSLVALKIISRRKLMARDMAGRVDREISYLQLLRHPHIIKLHAVIKSERDIVMVLEYAGQELFNYLVDNGKLGEDKARTFFQQIICAVEYCHRHKIVHRDLKPENLLLDENLHVKIADFGLSNIMTDGNFLKTSCGSPNYAAPEVISGKLYAGPEVDVWSCGVILYVLLVGRLPFDDEYIPSLFKKISQGQYHVPQYISKGAASLMKKMLHVNPVYRITVQQIREDPWFNKNLPDYLQPKHDEFIGTAVDPNKPIDPQALAPSKSPEEVEKLHGSVVGKLRQTMGYPEDDVQQALAVSEPNAIKDAYLIVRENHITSQLPSMTKDPNMKPFLAQSPTDNTKSPIAAIHEQIESGSGSPQGQGQKQARAHSHRLSSDTTAKHQARSPGGTIAVLPSSLPDYHKAYMSGQPKDPTQDTDEEFGNLDKETRVRRLNPHSRSSTNIERMDKPEGMTPVPAEKKKPRPTKWQFGIRSRNPAAEAMLAIYRALKAMGAQWEVPQIRKPGDFGEGHERAKDMGCISGSSDDEAGGSRGNSPDRRSSSQGGRRRQRKYGSWNDWGYNVPADPWIIKARFRKSGMLPPGTQHPTSANSSRVDLTESSASQSPDGRRSSTQSTEDFAGSSAKPSPSNVSLEETDTGEPALQPAHLSLNSSTRSLISNVTHSPESQADDSAFVYLTIQLYALGTKDQEMYVVDFKCAGYERLVRQVAGTISKDQSVDSVADLNTQTGSSEPPPPDFGGAGLEQTTSQAISVPDADNGNRRERRESDDQNDSNNDSASDTSGQPSRSRSRSKHSDDDDDGHHHSSPPNPSPVASNTSFTSGRPSEGGNWEALERRQPQRQSQRQFSRADNKSQTRSRTGSDRDPNTERGHDTSSASASQLKTIPSESRSISSKDFAGSGKGKGSGSGTGEATITRSNSKQKNEEGSGSSSAEGARQPPEQDPHTTYELHVRHNSSLTSGTSGGGSDGKASNRDERDRDDKGQNTTGKDPNQRKDEELKQVFMGHGRAANEKDVSSPFPFLDVASRLIIQLAEAS